MNAIRGKEFGLYRHCRDVGESELDGWRGGFLDGERGKEIRRANFFLGEDGVFLSLVEPDIRKYNCFYGIPTSSSSRSASITSNPTFSIIK